MLTCFFGCSQLSGFDWYLIIVNILGFVLFAINTWLYSHTPNGQIDIVITIVSIIGGSLGVLIGVLVFERALIKEVMMSRVFIFCVFIIQLIIFLIIKGYIKSDITVNIVSFFASHKLLLVYLIIINVVALVAFAMDKIAAIEKRSRIRIVTLLGLCIIGGSIGGLLGMHLFRHKTKIDYFKIGVPLIIMQLFLLFYLMNGKIL